MKLDGKKKWTAAIIAIAGTVVAQFAPEQQDAVMQVVQTLAPLVVGGLYIIAQWSHDEKKEQVKVEQEKTKRAEANNVAVTQEIDRLADEVSPLVEANYEPFDPEEFAGVDDKKLKNRAAQTYLDVSPITVFFAAQGKGKVTKCRHVDQALAYWDHLLNKVMDAFQHMFGFPYEEADQHLADDNQSCPYYSVDNMARQKGIHFWTMLRNVRWVIRKQSDLETLAETDIDWQQKLGKQSQTLFGVGSLASELLNTSQ